MYVFEAEKSIAHLLTDDNCIASFNVPLKNISEENEKKVIAKALEFSLANKNDKDLFYVPTVLVTVGCNENDDIFEKAETWKARKTPEDKPFNFEHTENDIIGHIVGNYVVDSNFDVVSDDTPIEKLPEKFHIITPSVIYRHWRDAKLQDRANNLIDEINQGMWCVSMEALFTDFDYMLLDKDNKIFKTIARQKDTSYLTKHLRVYGGSGQYDGYRIGRVLKNITFSGKGLVKNPANPESVILNNQKENTTDAKLGVLTSIESEQNNQQSVEILERSNCKKDHNTMANENHDKEIVELKAKVEFLSKERDEAKAKAAEAAEQLVKDKISGLEASIKARDESLAESKTKIETLEKELLASKKTNEESVASLEKVNKELNQIKVEKTKAERIAALEKAGFSIADATSKYEKFAGVADEVFAEIVTSFSNLKSEDTQAKDKSKDKKNSKNDMEKDLEDAEASKDPDMNDVGEEEDAATSTIAVVAKRLGERFAASRKNKNKNLSKNEE